MASRTGATRLGIVAIPIADGMFLAQSGPESLAAYAVAITYFSLLQRPAVEFFQAISLTVKQGSTKRTKLCILKASTQLALVFVLIAIAACVPVWWLMSAIQGTEGAARSFAFFAMMLTWLPATLGFSVITLLLETQHRSVAPIAVIWAAAIGNVACGIAVLELSGVGGAGLSQALLVLASTSALRWVAFVALAIWFAASVMKNQDDQTSKRQPDYRQRLLQRGLPFSISALSDHLFFFVLANIAIWTSASVAAQYEVAMSIISLAFTFMLGVAITAKITITQAARFGGRTNCIRSVFYIGTCFSACIATAYAVHADDFVSIYLAPGLDRTVLTDATFLICCVLFLEGFVLTLSAVMRAIGFSMYVTQCHLRWHLLTAAATICALPLVTPSVAFILTLILGANLLILAQLSWKYRFEYLSRASGLPTA